MHTLTATSPDGRSWKIDSVKEPFKFGGERGFAWSYVISTVIVLGIVLVLAFVSWYFAIGLGILLLIWLGERISNHLRPRYRARTEGPPPEEMTWKATGFTQGKVEQRLVQMIAGGNVDIQPRGLSCCRNRATRRVWRTLARRRGAMAVPKQGRREAQ